MNLDYRITGVLLTRWVTFQVLCMPYGLLQKTNNEMGRNGGDISAAIGMKTLLFVDQQ